MTRRIVMSFVLALATVAVLPLTASASVAHDADLSIDLSSAPDPVRGGDVVTFHAVVTNNGPNDALGVAVTDDLPPGFQFDAGGSSHLCFQKDNSVFCLVGFLEDGDSVDVLIAATTPCQEAPAQDSAEVHALSPDPDHDNNTASTQVTIQTPCNGNEEFIDDGGKVTTDPDHEGTQPDQGVFETAAIKVPTGVSGEVGIDLNQGGGAEADSEECPDFNTLVATTDQPAGSENNRLALIFNFSPCSFPPGMDIHGATMFKDSGDGFVKVRNCTGEQWPDPCVRRKRVLANGDFRYRVLWSGTGDPSWRPH
jgi:uncharacterized repeat protein (TIGR01451 family)